MSTEDLNVPTHVTREAYLDALQKRDAAAKERDEAIYYQRMRAAEREMHARELHHFEEEQKLAAAESKIQRALDVVKSGSVPLGVPVARHYDRLLAETRRILTEGSDQ